MLKGKQTLFLDQYGAPFRAKTIKQLVSQVGGVAVSKMYVDGVDGHTYHIGYIVGSLWCTAYTPCRERA